MLLEDTAPISIKLNGIKKNYREMEWEKNMRLLYIKERNVKSKCKTQGSNKPTKIQFRNKRDNVNIF